MQRRYLLICLVFVLILSGFQQTFAQERRTIYGYFVPCLGGNWANITTAHGITRQGVKPIDYNRRSYDIRCNPTGAQHQGNGSDLNIYAPITSKVYRTYSDYLLLNDETNGVCLMALHLSRIDVRNGSTVTTGQLLGRSNGDGGHVHIAVFDRPCAQANVNNGNQELPIAWNELDGEILPVDIEVGSNRALVSQNPARNDPELTNWLVNLYSQEISSQMRAQVEDKLANGWGEWEIWHLSALASRSGIALPEWYTASNLGQYDHLSNLRALSEWFGRLEEQTVSLEIRRQLATKVIDDNWGEWDIWHLSALAERSGVPFTEWYAASNLGQYDHLTNLRALSQWFGRLEEQGVAPGIRSNLALNVINGDLTEWDIWELSNRIEQNPPSETVVEIPSGSNIEGWWIGTLAQPMGGFQYSYPFEMHITQTGQTITGTSRLEGDNAEYALMEITGTFQDNRLVFEEISILEGQDRTGYGWCMKYGTLELTGGTLSGAWEAENCSGGTISLTRAP